ncbi:MAG TPA: Sec-independent protein translocase protein TatB [Povalibacter sp.]|uniref:Sec-independent protein translocase protein TatB n=1 Tax=Povalibacter sp. TaxID=1962978 RepID=UPI002C4FFADB|nr:Sec-independent protein translocase protein TatB [Povalibacter sp.]HMN44718.1 Sec-independent protein translocase protein TatB [Povalibacter sp.]
MFEVGFTEIVLILGLALLVLGPEKLPGLAQKIGRWTGRARSMARQLRTQLEQEVTIEELAKSRPGAAQSSSPAEPSIHTPAAPEPPETAPHRGPEIDLDQTVSGIEPEPAPPASSDTKNAS